MVAVISSAIAASGLRKAYQDKTVLDGIDLDVRITPAGQLEIIFLDEPTTGLDPRSGRTMWEAIRELVADGMTVFLTTQYLEEADIVVRILRDSTKDDRR